MRIIRVTVITMSKVLKKKIFNLGLIGTGKILKKHLSIINSLNKFNVIAIHSRTHSKGIEFCKENNIPLEKYIKNMNIFLKMENIDAFFICVSVESIDKILNKIIKTHKPFFIEKPPIVNLNTYRTICNYIKKNKILNMVGLNRRHYSNLLKIKSLFDNSGGLQSIQIEGNERIWQKKSITMFRKKNWLILNSIHTLDLIFFFCGMLDKTFIVKTNKNVYSILGQSKSGINFSYTSNWNSPGGWSIKAQNNKYYVIIDPLEVCVVKNRSFKSKEIKMSNNDKNFKPGFYLQIVNFYELLIRKEHTYPSIGIENCNGLYSLIKKIYEK